MNIEILTSKKNNNTQEVAKLKSEYCTCLTWVLIGLLVGGVPLTSVTTLYIYRQSQTSTNQTSSSESIELAYLCNGISSYTRWESYSNSGLTMPIDTSSCNFNSTPLYFTSIAGFGLHYTVDGYGGIYSATKTSFRIYMRWTNGATMNQTFAYSQQNAWNVNWFGIIP